VCRVRFEQSNGGDFASYSAALLRGSRRHASDDRGLDGPLEQFDVAGRLYNVTIAVSKRAGPAG
jgi:hypothetical protein